MFATPNIQAALTVAARAHHDQKRKVSGEPYIVHPVTVALILAEFTHDENTLAAALLHDVLEDQSDKFSEQEMMDLFGDDVTNTVKAVSKDSSIEDWRERNKDYIRRLVESGNEAAVLICTADKIANLSSILKDYDMFGPEIWDKFNAGANDQLWWYNEILAVSQELIPERRPTLILADLVQKLTEIVAK